jgi:hypothetical protein
MGGAAIELALDALAVSARREDLYLLSRKKTEVTNN